MMLLTKDELEKEYYYSLAAYNADPTYSRLMNLLELVYEDGYLSAAAEYAEGFTDE